MSVLDQVVAVVPVAMKAALSVEERNVLRHPNPAVTPAVRHGALTHDTAGPLLVPTPPERVAVFLGPGATFEGIADTLAPLYAAAAGGGGPKAPTRDELARALVVYNRDHLPTADWRNHKVGLRLLLPVEIDPANGEWVVDADRIRTWSRAFLPAWRARLRTPAPPLAIPNPFVLEGEATAIVARLAPLDRPTIERLGLDLRERALRNPFEPVILTLAVLRAVERTKAGLAVDTVLAAVDGTTAHQAAQLASTRAGNGLLRKFAAQLAAAPPGVDPVRLNRARALLDDALFQGPPAARTLVAHRELPETSRQLDPRAGEAKPTAGSPIEPRGGVHRLVLGRDLAVGRPSTTRAGGVSVTGPGFSGRIPLDQYLRAEIAALNPGSTEERRGLLTLLSIDDGIELLDAVRTSPPGVIAVGLDGWSTGATGGLAALLFDFKTRAADEFDLFFALHGLDVEGVPGTPNQFRLLQLGADGRPTIMNAAMVLAFFGGKVAAGGAVTFAPEWAARFRLVALVSLAYRRAQVLRAVERIKNAATTTPHLVRAGAFGPFPAQYRLDVEVSALDKLVGEKLEGTAAAPLTGYLDGERARGATSADTLAGALVDLTTGAARPQYAGSFDDETYYVGSLAKIAPLYAAYELRRRLQRLVDEAKLHGGLTTATAGWQEKAQVLPAVRKVWLKQMAKGFPGLGTGPDRMPKFDTIFEFEIGGVVKFKKGPADQAEVNALDAHTRPPADRMKFHQWLSSMTLWSHNIAASMVIDALGFPYINGALREAGFFDPATRRGIWVSGNYTGDDWAKQDYMPLTARGTRHYKDTTNFTVSARQVARLLTLLAQRNLFDTGIPGGGVTTCDEMILMMKKNIFGAYTWITRSLEEDDPANGIVPRPITNISSKIGIGDPSPVHGRVGHHDCAIVERDQGGKTLRYVIVFLGGFSSETNTYHGFVRALDDCIVASNP